MDKFAGVNSSTLTEPFHACRPRSLFSDPILMALGKAFTSAKFPCFLWVMKQITVDGKRGKDTLPACFLRSYSLDLVVLMDTNDACSRLEWGMPLNPKKPFFQCLWNSARRIIVTRLTWPNSDRLFAGCPSVQPYASCKMFQRAPPASHYSRALWRSISWLCTLCICTLFLSCFPLQHYFFPGISLYLDFVATLAALSSLHLSLYPASNSYFYF